MKICMFTNTYIPHVGGVARSVAAFTEDLRSINHPVMVIAPKFDGQNDDQSEDILRVPAVQNFNSSDFSIPLPLPFYIDSKLGEFEPDIMHSHHPFLLGDSALRAARKYDRPLIFTHHTRYEEYIHYISSYSQNMRRFVINLSREYGNMCDVVIAPSESIKKMLIGQGVFSPLEVIPTGTDISFFSNANPEPVKKKYKISPDKKIIGHVGRLAPEKNLEYLTQAISIVLKKNPDCLFTVTGDGEMKQRMQDICEAGGVRDKLILTGQLEGEELANIYASMDLFVFSSLSETQGMVLVEAMAAGTPVIALDASGVREVIKNGENGILLDDYVTPAEFADVVEKYLYSERRLASAKTRALETAKNFSRETSLNKLIDLYKRVLEISKIKKTRHTEGLESWEKLLMNIKTEWELISQKTRAFSHTLFS